MTFSLVARCARTGHFGLVIASSSPAVAARCSFGRAGVGAVATQNVTDPALGPVVLDKIGRGANATDAIAAAVAQTPHAAYRQLLAVDPNGQSAAHTGDNALGLFSAATAKDAAAGGNLLATETVPHVMLTAFAEATGPLPDRLMTALIAGQDAGGEAGPVHSAGLKVVEDLSWPTVDLRVDWAEQDPIGQLVSLWALYKPQRADYIQRAQNPAAAPSYGVPGDQ